MREPIVSGSRIKDCFILFMGMSPREREKSGETYFLASSERQRKGTYTPNTTAVLVSYNRALDRTAQARSSLD